MPEKGQTHLHQKNTTQILGWAPAAPGYSANWASCNETSTDFKRDQLAAALAAVVDFCTWLFFCLFFTAALTERQTVAWVQQ